MRIAYISPIYFSDVDLSYLQELSKIDETFYFIPIGGNSSKGAAINISKVLPSSRILSATEYEELYRLGNIINLNNTYIINSGIRGKFRRLILTFKLLRKLKQMNIDVVHLTEMPQWYDFPLYFIRKKIVLSVHDPFVHSCVTSKRYEFRRRIAFALLQNFIIFNKQQRSSFIKHYHLENKFVFDSSLSIYTYLRMYKNKESKIKHILFFGQITSHKGLDFLLPAMKIVHQSHPEAKLIVAGRGKFHFDITQYQNLDYIDIYNRFIPDEELSTLIQESIMVVCPYKDATQSGVVMSAYAFGVPVIATNVGGLPEMVQHLKTGLIVPACDIQALVDAMILLLDNFTLREQLSENIIDYYENGEKAWSNIAADLHNNVYKKIVQ